MVIKSWSYYWKRVGIISFLCAFWFLLIPSEPKNALIWGLSTSRIACALFFVLLGIFATLLARKKIAHYEEKQQALKFRIGVFAYLLAFLSSICWVILISPLREYALVKSLRISLAPMLFWMVFIFIFTYVSFLSIPKKNFNFRTGFWTLGGIVILFLCGIFTVNVVLQSGIGMETISGTFYRQGVSLLEGQLVLPILLGFISYLFGALINYLRKRNSHSAVLIVLLAVIVWSAAYFAWTNVPFEGRSYFAPALRAPNYNFYPSSDAEIYDMHAQSILIGNGFRNGTVVVRPFYIAILSFFHTIAGNNYLDITNLQIALLSLLPVLIFLIAKNIFSVNTGLIAAAYMIFREINNIRITPLVMTSNSRLLLSDLPTALMIAGFMYGCICWLKSKSLRSRLFYALVSGGAAGVAMLIRTQAFVLIPATVLLLCVEAFSKKRLFKRLFLECSLFICAFFIVIGPWVALNFISPNTATNPESSENAYLELLYRRAASADLAETDGMTIAQIIVHYPKQVYYSIASHFANNELSTFLVLPVRETCAKLLADWFQDQSLFWYRESHQSALEKRPLLILSYWLILSIGIFLAIKRTQWVGLIPLYFHFMYSLGCSLALNSGFRFILPVDWVGYFYFAVGVAGIIEAIGGNLLRLPFTAVMPAHIPKFFATKSVFGLCVALLVIIGLILPILDRLIPYRYASFSETDAFASIHALCGAEIVLPSDVEIVSGRFVYPRFYAAGEGDSGGGSISKSGLPYDRMVLNMVSIRSQTVTLRTSQPFELPDPLDAVVAIITKSGYSEINALIYTKDGMEICVLPDQP